MNYHAGFSFPRAATVNSSRSVSPAARSPACLCADNSARRRSEPGDDTACLSVCARRKDKPRHRQIRRWQLVAPNDRQTFAESRSVNLYFGFPTSRCHSGLPASPTAASLPRAQSRAAGPPARRYRPRANAAITMIAMTASGRAKARLSQSAAAVFAEPAVQPGSPAFSFQVRSAFGAVIRHVHRGRLPVSRVGAIIFGLATRARCARHNILRRLQTFPPRRHTLPTPACSKEIAYNAMIRFLTIINLGHTRLFRAMLSFAILLIVFAVGVSAQQPDDTLVFNTALVQT